MIVRVAGCTAGVAVGVPVADTPASAVAPCNVELRLANDPGVSAQALAWVREHCPCARCAEVRAGHRRQEKL